MNHGIDSTPEITVSAQGAEPCKWAGRVLLPFHVLNALAGLLRGYSGIRHGQSIGTYLSKGHFVLSIQSFPARMAKGNWQKIYLQMALTI